MLIFSSSLILKRRMTIFSHKSQRWCLIVVLPKVEAGWVIPAGFLFSRENLNNPLMARRFFPYRQNTNVRG
jgi:hypothetical protein